MQPEYLARISESVQEFIHVVEERSDIDINVVLCAKQNEGGPTGQGILSVIIEAHRIQLLAPTNGYFPDGAVRHEVLHVQRFHNEGVPKLVLADEEKWDGGFADALGALDNAIEHLVIVPVELQFHPERREHWVAVLSEVWSGFPFVPEHERRLAACMHWTFMRHVLSSSPQIEIARKYLIEYALLGMADDFADKFLSVVANKEEMVRLLFLTFPEISKNRAALEYINSMTGTRQSPIP